MYRGHVIAAVENFRRAPLSSSERRYLARKDFIPNRLRPEVVEVLCDYIQAHGLRVPDLFLFENQENAQARALWYTYATYSATADKKKGASKTGEERFDPHGEGKSVFEVDVRALQPNIHVACEALVIYLRESDEEFVNGPGYTAFLMSAGVPGATDAVKQAALAAMLRDTSAAHINILQRLVMLVNALSEAVRPAAHKALGAAVLRHGGGSPEQEQNTRALRGEVFGLLCPNHAKLLPGQYTPSPHRLGQARHFVMPERLAESEWELLLAVADGVSQYKGGEVAVEQHTLQEHLFRVVKGSFSVYVGETRVGELIALDWFGETAFLGNHFARARVVADSKGGSAYKLSYGKLSAVLLARPDLARKFFAMTALESASRLNVAMIMASQSTGVRDLAVDPRMNVPHPLRTASVSREKESGESRFMYDANLHAVRVWSCRLMPSDPKKRRAVPLESLFFVFPRRMVCIYQKGHSEKNVEVKFADVREFTQEPSGSFVKIGFVAGKKQKTMTLDFASASTAKAVGLVTTLLRNGGVDDASVKDFGPVSAAAVFDFVPGSRPNELPLAAGDRVTVLDRADENWYYGFKTDHPDRKGLFPVSFVELRPLGVGQHGAMQPSDWKELEVFMERVVLSRGQYATVEGDAVHSGDLMFVESGELLAMRSLLNGLSNELGFIRPGETFGELMFMLGGDPRASIVVASDSATVLRVRKKNCSRELC